MKSRYLLASAMTVIFTVSHMLPALQEDTGFMCFRWCLGVLLDFNKNEIPQWLYYGGFAISNIAFVAFAAFAFTQKSFSGKLRLMIAVLSLHVISWPLLNLSHIEGIRIGYYLWLSAYLMLLYISTRYRTMTKEHSRPAEPVTAAPL